MTSDIENLTQLAKEKIKVTVFSEVTSSQMLDEEIAYFKSETAKAAKAKAEHLALLEEAKKEKVTIKKKIHLVVDGNKKVARATSRGAQDRAEENPKAK